MRSTSLRTPAAAAAAVAVAAAATASAYYALTRRRRATARAHSATAEDAQCTRPAPPLVQPSARPVAPCCARHFSWTVFWDLENTRVPSSIPPAAFVHALCATLRTVTPYPLVHHPQPVLRILAVANIHTTPLQQRKALQSNGVSILHFETDGRKDACDKALITELCLLTRQHTPPMGVALLSSDVDFAYALSRLTALGYYTAVVTPNMKTLSRQLATVPNTVLTFDQILVHVSPLLTPQPPHNPKIKPAPAQQADQKQHAQRDARKRQQKQKSPKRPPPLTNATGSPDKPHAKHAQRASPQPQSSVSPAQQANQKQRAQRNARKRQQKQKSPKHPPPLTNATCSPDKPYAKHAQRMSPQPPSSVSKNAAVSPAMRLHIANATQASNSISLTKNPNAACFRYTVYVSSLVSLLCIAGALLWFNYCRWRLPWWAS